MASTAENTDIVHTSPEILTTTSDFQERAQSSMEDQVCDVEMLPVPEASSPELPLPLIVEEALIRAQQEEDFIRTSHDAADAIFVVPFPDPASTLNIHGSSAIQDQGVQGTSSSEQMALRAASSDVVHENGVQTPISYTSLANNPTVGPNPPPRHLFSDPYEYELEKIRLEEEHLKKCVEEMTSQLMAELDRKMAEARSEFDRELQEYDAACKAEVMEVEAHMGLVRTGSLLANAFVSKCSERSASNDLAAVRAAMVSQHSTQQQQAVHMNSTVTPRVQASTHMSTSAPPRPSVEASIINSSGPFPHLPRHTTTTQPSQQTVQAHSHVNSTAPAPPVTAVEPQTPNHLRPLARFPRHTSTQPSPISQQAVPQSNTNVNSTALPRPSVTAGALPRSSVTTGALPRPSVTPEALPPLHSPLSNTPRPRPRPVISNLTPSSSTPVRGPAPHLVRAMAPHLARRPAPHLRQYGSSSASMSAASAAATTHQRASVQEQGQQQQGKSDAGLVHLSDED